MKIYSASDTSLLIKETDRQKLLPFAELLEAEFSDYILDLTPAYFSLLVHYDILKISHVEFIQKIQKCFQNKKFALSSQQKSGVKNKIHKIPVYYGTEVGWDLEEIGKEKSISLAEIIELHSCATYEVYAIGFRPGFGYLGDLEKKLHHPRKKNPRLQIPMGSIAIANEQTAIYPDSSPGGWNLIGKTYLAMVDWQKENPCLLQVGDKVKFEPITKKEFISKGGQLGT